MKPIAVRRNAVASAAILCLGTFAYGALCMRAIGCRDYDHLDPFWFSLRWLWPVPVLLSAPFDGRRWTRWLGLVAYCLVTGGIGGGAGALARFARPHMMSVGDMIALAPFYGVFHFALIAPVEAAVQVVLGLFRTFADDAPRCAEADGPPSRQATWVAPVAGYMCVVVVLGVAFPPAYRHHSLETARRSARAWAHQSWDEGKAVWPTWEGERLFTPSFSELIHDPASGLPVVAAHSFMRRVSAEAYRAVIEEKLAEFGPRPLVQYLFTDDELVQFIEEGGFRPVQSFPFRHGNVVIEHPAAGAQYRVAAANGGVLVVVGGHHITTYHPDGRLLRHTYAEVTHDPLRAVPVTW